jgi:hypothetical protein
MVCGVSRGLRVFIFVCMVHGGITTRMLGTNVLNQIYNYT